MRWVSYFILAYIVLGIQTGVEGFVRFHGAGPNFVLLAVIFIALNAPRDSALLGCFVMGALQDLTTQQAIGLYAMSYGLVAMFIVTTQQAVYREHPLTHFSMALVAGLLTSAVLGAHGIIHPPAPAHATEAGVALPAIRYAPSTLLLTALYTAVLAPVIIGGLQRFKKMFGFQAPRRRRVRAY